MKYVISGATSFLGVEICKYLISEMEEVYAVCRKGSDKVGSLPVDPYLHVINADMSEYGNLYEHIHKADVFINLAWEGTGHSGRNLADVQRDNIDNTHNAMMAARKMGCSLFVESGSQAEYGTVLGKIKEENECNPFSEYGKAKKEVCDIGFSFAELTGMKYLHLRIFSLYGETDHPWTLIMNGLTKMKHDAPIDLSDCTQNWNFLHVEDAAKQVFLLCENALHADNFQHEVYNIASDDTRQLKTFVNQMKYLTNSKSILNFGVIKSKNIVSLDPDINKTKNAIGFIANHRFESDILSIYNIIQ